MATRVLAATAGRPSKHNLIVPSVWLWMHPEICTSRITNGRVRRVDPSGTITTVAGQGGTGNSTDGIPAVQDQLSGVDSAAVDDSGNLYITQSAENRVRKVSFQTTLSVPQISTGGVTNAASYGSVLAPGSCSAFSAQTWLPQQPAPPACRCR